MPRPRSLLLATSLVLASGLVACRQNDDPSAAAELLARVTAADYRSWERAPGYEKRRPAASPHSDAVEIFVSDEVATTLAGPAGAKAWPIGSLIVKEGFETDGTHALTAIMEKRDDGWFWAEYDAETGEPKYSGAPKICTDCHASVDDFVRAFRLP